MTSSLRDIGFGSFDWAVAGSGDLSRVEGLESFRGLIVRWLLTEKSDDLTGLTEEEVEVRRKYSSGDARRRGYAEPEGVPMRACLPWAPTWGAGIKRYLNQPMTPALVAEVTTVVRAGLARLEGVRQIYEVRVSAAVDGRLTVSWRVGTSLGDIGGKTDVQVHTEAPRL